MSDSQSGLIVDDRYLPDSALPTEEVKGVLDVANEGSGLLRPKYAPSDNDIYISPSQIRRFNLRNGDLITGLARRPKENERYWGLLKVETVNGNEAVEMQERPNFDDLTAIYPDEQIKLATDSETMTTRLLDLVAPIGFGQRGLIVSPPKAGKTWLLKDIITGIGKNYGDKVHLMATLIGERPEEVTDIARHVKEATDGRGEVAASNFDETPESQTRIAELALDRAKRLLENGVNVIIVLDSITRLARAYNLALPSSGRTLTGGFDPQALFPQRNSLVQHERSKMEDP
jgi:transcription termination factor Rho